MRAISATWNFRWSMNCASSRFIPTFSNFAPASRMTVFPALTAPA